MRRAMTLLDQGRPAAASAARSPAHALTDDLRRLESESISIIREALAGFARPVLLYSIGKDSSVLLHLARKAVHPAPLDVPVLHIDTTWKFREMIAFRDRTARELGLRLIVRRNEAAVAAGAAPFAKGSVDYTHLMKTIPLREALAEGRFDAALGGARRDEEKSRAKERVFSVRSGDHGWDPRAQRPEFWSLRNTELRDGETMRVFPLSNWTELDVWRYIAAEAIPVVPLYFSAPRPVVEAGGQLLMADDHRLPIPTGQTPVTRRVRFRTLGCYPLTAAVESEAADIAAIIAELESSTRSERAGRLIDFDQTASMERKKRQGYF
jgi:sulfate adenylyltransferase subunit 2